MNIYIAKDYNSVPLGLVLSKNKDIASAFFIGKYGTFHSIEEINPTTIEDKLPGSPCFSIIQTREHKEGKYGEEKTYRVINKR